MKNKISKNDKLALEGLKILSEKANLQLEYLMEAVREITGDDEDLGHSADFVYCRELTVDQLLERLNIDVEK